MRKDIDMTAGLPGSGIGGLFYLLTALLMPVHELGRTLMGLSSAKRWRLVIQQAALAAGILLAVWATGWALGWVVHWIGPVTTGGGLAAQVREVNILRLTPLVITLATLGGVMLAVQALRLLVYGKPAGPAEG
jgi:hypothetical protein